MQFAMLFPGQGSQTIGMLKSLAEKYSKVISIFEESSSILGYDLWKLVNNGPIEKLNKTCYAQPAILTASVAIYRIWQENNGTLPSIIAGHSLGEYSALVCAGVINFTDAVKLVEIRGKLMQEAVPENNGAMQAIIGLDHKLIQKLCESNSYGQIVSLANFNSPKQIIISGNKEAVKRVGIACKNAGAKRIIQLPVSVPSHCELMKPAAYKFKNILKLINFNKPCIPLLNNVDVKIQTNPKYIRSALIRQLYKPVRWIEIIKRISSYNIKYIFEIGPGKVLTSLNKCILNNKLIAIAVNDTKSLTAAIRMDDTKYEC